MGCRRSLAFVLLIFAWVSPSVAAAQHAHDAVGPQLPSVAAGQRLTRERPTTRATLASEAPKV